jgi:hypothetical protein
MNDEASGLTSGAQGLDLALLTQGAVLAPESIELLALRHGMGFGSCRCALITHLRML